MTEQLTTASLGTLETVAGAALKEVERRQQELPSPDSGREVSLQSGFGGASPLMVTIGGGRKKQPRQQMEAELATKKQWMEAELATKKQKGGNKKQKKIIYFVLFSIF